MHFTPAQFKIIAIVLKTGAKNADIAKELGISTSAVKSQLNKIYEKLGIQNNKIARSMLVNKILVT